MTIFCTYNMTNNIQYGVTSHCPSMSGGATAKSLEEMVIGMGFRGVVPLRHLRHVPPRQCGNSLHNRVNSITLCVTLNANTGKIVLDSPCDSMYSNGQ